MSAENTQRNSTGQAADGNLQLNALVYAARGWPVFPCKPHTKIPLTGHGYKDATTDLGQIEEWWWRYPGANIGIPTGIMFDVVDWDQLDEFSQRRIATPGTVALTGRGIHWYVQPTGYGNRRLRSGVDFKGKGGYVIVPPSIHPSGPRYVWQRQDALVRAPDWVKPKEKRMWQYDGDGPTRKGVKALRTMYCELANQPEGNRNNYLFWAASAASTTGLTQQEVRPVLTEAALSSGLAPREVELTINQGFARW